ncbi:MAG TPA: YihY/virulence factor BrkB family protein [Streptosporangiaceae bacterium]|nr:YihY/virulence factor BrkB family protein [Streptosporangiaceae bacterium]
MASAQNAGAQNAGAQNAGAQDAGTRRREPVPKDPTDLSGASWRAAAKRALKKYKRDNLQDRAAALTYFAIQSIFPGLLVLISLLGILGTSATKTLVANLDKAAPSSVRTIIGHAITHLQSNHAASGIVGIVGIVLALWSASNYVAAFMRASNIIYGVPEGRPIWKTAPTRLGVTIVTMILLVAAAVIVVVSGGVAHSVGNALGLGPTAVTVWDIAKWPVLLIIVGLILAILFWASPNAKRGFQWVSPGGFLAVVLWLIASGLFAVYVANFSHYNKIYGSMAGVIIFLIWMWISNIAILLGAEFNAELERGRAIAAGHPADQEPFAELRDDRKVHKNQERPLPG